MPRGTFQCPHPCREPLLTHTSIGGPPTLAGSFGLVSCRGYCSCPLGLDTGKILFVPFKTGVSVSPSPLEGLSSPHFPCWLKTTAKESVSTAQIYSVELY